ncbi:right-handed parallel beta-helix repeat-containing protein [bacterium]|nr:right-handed parallel beta-helix repeat-containing protein [bacterium]MBU1652168.1 right-handed parallel beta-helix repeat-containing protein [bacterium]MBU1881834.1 right-handed parallel beta-helix repeat-containing protein [bacterium]
MNRKLSFIIITVLAITTPGYTQTTIPGGDVSGTWNAAGSPYLIEDLINIPTIDTLIIEPGVDVIFQGQYMFEVRGSLIAEGSESDSIRITAADTSSGWKGLRLYHSRACILTYCIVEYGNSFGIGIQHIGGGLYSDSSDPIISNCRFTRNRAETGGAMAFMWYSQPIITNTLIDNNWSEWGGGLFADEYSYVRVINCTVTSNTGVYLGGGIRGYYTAIYSIINTIVEGNYGAGGINLSGVLDDTIQYCDVYNNEGGNIVGAVPLGALEPVLTNVNGDSCDIYYNLSFDPQYYATSGDSAYFLAVTSPCIDAGDPLSPCDPDNTIADMGAFYHYHTETIIPGGNVSGTWTSTFSPYIVIGDITVPVGQTLSIEPGVEVRFDEATGLTVYGSLFADGTIQPGVGDTILFTSNLPDPQPGDWNQVKIAANGTAAVTFCAFEYGTSFHSIYSVDLLLTDCRFSIPITGEPDDATMLRCLTTVDQTFYGAGISFIECVFSGFLYFDDGAGGNYTVTDCSIAENLSLLDYASTFTVSGTDVGGDVPVTIEGTSYFTSCDIEGQITGGDVTSIDSCYVGGGIEWQQYGESGSVDVTNSTLAGNTYIGDWIYCDMIDNLIDGDVHMDDCWSMQFQGNEIHGSLSGSVSVMGPYDLEIVDNNFSDGGINVYFKVDGTVNGNSVCNSPSAGIAVTFTNSLLSPIIENNTVHASAANGVDITGPGSGSPTCTIKNNIISSSSGYGIAMSGAFFEPMPPFNDTWNNTSGDYYGCSAGVGSINLDPKYVDPPNGDYHLQSTTGSYHGGAWTPDLNHSPCIDAGDPLSPFSLEPEPNGGIVNMGAYGNTEEASKSFSPSYPNLIIELTYISGSPVPPDGGTLVFDLFVANNDSVPVSFDAWLDLSYEGGTPFTAVLRAIPNFTPGQIIDRQDMWYPINAGYPAGDYTMSGKVGDFPNEIWDSSSFPFEKLGHDDGTEFTFIQPDINFPDPFSMDGLSQGELYIPDTFTCDAYPNPFNPTTTITFDLPVAAEVKFDVFDISGSRVGVGLVPTRRYPPGTHSITFDGSGLASGIYVYRLETSGSGTTIGTGTPTTVAGKMVLMK